MNNTSDLLENWLKEQGFRSERDDNGNLLFRYEGANLICFKDDNDKQYLHIVMPAIYKINGDRIKVLEAINSTSRDIKTLKAFLVEEFLWLDVEMFVSSAANIGDFIERSLDILVEGRKSIAKEIFG